jgi:hypothetical protein
MRPLVAYFTRLLQNFKKLLVTHPWGQSLSCYSVVNSRVKREDLFSVVEVERNEDDDTTRTATSPSPLSLIWDVRQPQQQQRVLPPCNARETTGAIVSGEAGVQSVVVLIFVH